MHIDIILITYGEPPQPKFWAQWRFSLRILQKLTRLVAPIPSFIMPFFAAYRAFMRTRLWKKEKFISPLEDITAIQAGDLGKLLQTQYPEIAWRVHVAYEFCEPSLPDVLHTISQNSPDQLLILPLYVADSDFTAGISRRDFAQWLHQNPGTSAKPVFITFRDHLEELAVVMANHVREKVQKLGLPPEESKNCALLCGCHGTVINPPPGIEDTGYQDTFRLFTLLEELLKEDFSEIKIGWLNHRLGGDWTVPTAEQSARKLKEENKPIVYFPFGFLADNAETILEGKMVMERLGIQKYHHLPCINDNPAFINLLAECIEKEKQKSFEG